MREVTVHKVGSNRGRPRIWLDGKRLTACGFTPGSHYFIAALPGLMRLSAQAPAALEDCANVRKVSGRGDKPIIDIVGKAVADTFGNATHVKVTWTDNAIFIERGKV